MADAECQRILELLQKHKISYELFEHEPTPTSADAARVRGTPLHEGAKAMVLRSKGTFVMCVLPGDKKIDLEKMRMILGTKRLSFATPDEVLKVTGCVIGSVPPFGNLFGILVYIDRHLVRNEYLSFNVGLTTKSIRMKKEDYLQVVPAIVEEFAE